MDNIDWQQIKERDKKGAGTMEEDDSDSEPESVDLVDIYQ